MVEILDRIDRWLSGPPSVLVLRAKTSWAGSSIATAWAAKEPGRKLAKLVVQPGTATVLERNALEELYANVVRATADEHDDETPNGIGALWSVIHRRVRLLLPDEDASSAGVLVLSGLDELVDPTPADWIRLLRTASALHVLIAQGEGDVLWGRGSGEVVIEIDSEESLPDLGITDARTRMLAMVVAAAIEPISIAELHNLGVVDEAISNARAGAVEARLLSEDASGRLALSDGILYRVLRQDSAFHPVREGLSDAVLARVASGDAPRYVARAAGPLATRARWSADRCRVFATDAWFELVGREEDWPILFCSDVRRLRNQAETEWRESDANERLLDVIGAALAEAVACAMLEDAVALELPLVAVLRAQGVAAIARGLPHEARQPCAIW